MSLKLSEKGTAYKSTYFLFQTFDCAFRTHYIIMYIKKVRKYTLSISKLVLAGDAPPALSAFTYFVALENQPGLTGNAIETGIQTTSRKVLGTTWCQHTASKSQPETAGSMGSN